VYARHRHKININLRQVREDDDEYGIKTELPVLTHLSNLSDFIMAKFIRAEAMLWVSQGVT